MGELEAGGGGRPYFEAVGFAGGGRLEGGVRGGGGGAYATTRQVESGSRRLRERAWRTLLGRWMGTM